MKSRNIFYWLAFLMCIAQPLRADRLSEVDLTKRVFLNELDLVNSTPYEAIEKLVRLAHLANLQGRRETYFRYEGMKVEDIVAPPSISIGVVIFGKRVAKEKMGIVLRDVSLWSAFEFVASKTEGNMKLVVLDEKTIAIMSKESLTRYNSHVIPKMKTAVEREIFEKETIIPQKLFYCNVSQLNMVNIFAKNSRTTLEVLRNLENDDFLNKDRYEPSLAEDAKKITAIKFNSKKRNRDNQVFSICGEFTYTQILKIAYSAWGVKFQVFTQGKMIIVKEVDVKNRTNQP